MPITFTTIEQVQINGQGGNDALRYNTPDNGTAGSILEYTPGANPDSGTINGSEVAGSDLTPLSFSNLGTATGANVSFTSTHTGGAVDQLNVEGTEAGDTFMVNGTNDSIQIAHEQSSNTNFITIPIIAASVSTLELDGLGGTDQFNVSGKLPFASTVIDDGGTVSLSGATANVMVNLADSTVLSSPTMISGYGGTVSLIDVAVANLDLTGGFTLTANGYASSPNQYTYTPTGANSGTFTDASVDTTFNFTNSTSTFTLAGNSTVGDVSNQVIVNGTTNSDVIEVDSPNRNVTVQNATSTVLEPVHLDPSTIQELQVNGLLGSDTFLVIPAPAVQTGPGGSSTTVPINLQIDIEGNPSANTDELVVAGSLTGTIAAGTVNPLPATDFVVNFVGNIPGAGVVRDYRSLTLLPDITYHNIGTVDPKVATATINGVPNQPQLLDLGADNYEPNDSITNAYFLGSGSTINVPHAAIFPNVLEHRFASADQDFYRVVAQTTGTLDFQVYFNLYPGLLPAGGNLNVLAFDKFGNPIASSTGGTAAFGVAGATGDARIRIPVVAGQTYYLEVVGGGRQRGDVVNGYNMAIVNTAPPMPFDLELSSSTVTVTIPVRIDGALAIPRRRR